MVQSADERTPDVEYKVQVTVAIAMQWPLPLVTVMTGSVTFEVVTHYNRDKLRRFLNTTFIVTNIVVCNHDWTKRVLQNVNLKCANFANRHCSGWRHNCLQKKGAHCDCLPLAAPSSSQSSPPMHTLPLFCFHYLSASFVCVPIEQGWRVQPAS